MLLHRSDSAWLCSAYLKERVVKNVTTWNKLQDNTFPIYAWPWQNMFSSLQSFLLHIKAVGKREEAHSRIFMQTQKPAEHASGLSVDAKKNKNTATLARLPRFTWLLCWPAPRSSGSMVKVKPPNWKEQKTFRILKRNPIMSNTCSI